MKYLCLCITLCISHSAFSQTPELKNWQLTDPDSGKYGTAANTVYSALIKDKISSPIIVAVIDGGTDTAHIDLKANLWTNPKEIPGNGKDDDRNGFIDDIHGWSYIGGPDGNVDHENTELTRLYKLGKDKLPRQYEWKEIKNQYKKEVKENNKLLKSVDSPFEWIKEVHKKSGKDSLTLEDLQNTSAHGFKMKVFRKYIIKAVSYGFNIQNFEDQLSDLKTELDNVRDYHLNVHFEGRTMVNDHPGYLNERFYGNNDVTGPEALHGTHVAGIIAAVRNNDEGMDGIADNVKIMIVRVVPDGDERDKDVANAIRYAADNGAKLINMSFGKPYSPNKEIVQDAIRYAQLKGVLIFHGAGNESANNDVVKSYPNALADGKEKAENFIDVGASDVNADPANFSNYGKTVDVFAPGVSIYSTVQFNKYKEEEGTSMSSPVACGVAALIWSYFPKLTALELKNVLLSSVEKISKEVHLPGQSKKKASYSDLCSSGGIVNAKKAFLKAEEISSAKP